MEKGLQTEVEHLRDASKQLERRLEDRSIEDEEKWTKREEIWKAKLSEADITLQTVEAREKILNERLEVTEKQLQEASEAMNHSVGGQSLSSEFAELHAQNVDLIKEKQALEHEVSRHKAEAQEASARQQAASARVELLQRELEEAQCSLSSYSRAVEAAKMETMELQAQLDAVTMDNINEEGKGNSLFSEVNDRRERVENQLKVYEEKYEVLKNNYDVKMAELQKTKIHNAKLLSIAGSSHSDTGHTARLEELLASERTKNKSLRDRLDTLETLSAKTEPLLAPVTGLMMNSSSNETVLVPHTQSDEYSYLSSLLADTQKSNEELKKQLKEQFRLSLEDSDKIREMTRKVNQLETSTQKLKAQNYTLKINIDELKCKKGEQKVQKKEPVRIYEKLVFEKKTEATATEHSDEDRFILKESISNIKAPAKAKSPDKNSSNEKENAIDFSATETKVDKPRKKVACFAESVETITAEGEKDTESLVTREAGVGDKAAKQPSKPQGKKKFGAANSVFVDDQDTAAECKQQ